MYEEEDALHQVRTMDREEANIYMKGIAIMAFGIIAAVFLMTLPVSAKKAVFTDSEAEVEEFTVCEAESPENGKIREISGMPCENREQFERWYAAYEQAAEEETAEQAEESEAVCEVSAAETAQSEPSDQLRAVLYSVNGETLNPDIQAYLYQRLADHGIEWFMPYAVMIAYQESHFDQYAVNQSNHKDMGLFQFRVQYYEGQDIFNPYEQIDIFTRQMANRANAGRTVSEMISAHNVSDFGGYNQAYVDVVLQHANNLREVD